VDDEKDVTSKPEDETVQAPEPSIADALEATDKKTTEDDKGEKPPAPKTYTEEEYDTALEAERKRYSGLDTKLTTMAKQHQDEIERINTALADAEERALQAREDAYLRKIEEDEGDVSSAKAIVERDRTSRKAEATAKKREVELEKRQKELDERDAILAVAGKEKKAHDLVKELGLDESVVEELRKCETPVEMEVKALRLHKEKAAIDAKPATETDETKGTKGGRDISKMSIEERLGLAAEGKI